MFLTVDLTRDVPIYQQIRDQVVQAIAAGRLAVGDPLPATRQLAADLGVNFHTVNKAYDLLRREGLVWINRKSGAVVRRDARSGEPEAGFAEDWETRLKPLLAEAIAQGLGEHAVLERCRSALTAFEGGQA